MKANEADSLITESLVLFREIGDPRGIGMALWLLAVRKILQGRLAEAAALLEQGLTAIQLAGDDAIAGQIYAALGYVSSDLGDYARAAELLTQAVAVCREAGDADGAHNNLVGFAWVLLAQGDVARAAVQLAECEAFFRQTQDQRRLAGMLQDLGYVRHLEGDDDAARALLREAIALQQLEQFELGFILSLERCAWMSADWHQPQRAARLLGAAEAAREPIGMLLRPGDKPLYDRHLERARADLDESVFDIAWAEGLALTLEQAIEYALEMPLTAEVVVPQPKTRQAAKQEFNGLTEREREVAARIAQGESNREIAERLVVSERTVETHVTNILNKLGFTSRAQIRKWATEKGLVTHQ
jgi:non-specific serine/threonine protein kinase